MLIPAREALALARAAPPDDPTPWERATSDAERAHIAAENGRPAPELASEVDALVADVAAGLDAASRLHAVKMRDEKMSQRVTEITSRWNIDSWADIDRDFAAAFRDYGADFATMSDDAIIARLRQSGKRIDLAQGIFGWMRVRWELANRHGAPPGFERFLRICQEVDDDPWRVRIRGALATEDFPGTVRAIADDAEHAGLELRTTFFLGFMLNEAGYVERAVDLFRHAFITAPGEYLLALQIAQWSHVIDPPRWQETLAYGSAAVAVHPKSTSGWYEIGLARDALGEIDDARAALRRALELTPAHVAARVALASSERRAGDCAAARRVLDEAPAPEPSDPAFVRARADLLLVGGDAAAAVERLGALADRQAAGELATIAQVTDFSATLDLLHQADATARALAASERALDRLTMLTRPQVEVWLRQVHSALLVLLGRADEALRQLDRIEAAVNDRSRAGEFAARRAQLTQVAEVEKRFDELATGEWTPANPLDLARAARVARRNGVPALATSCWEQALAGGPDAVDSILAEEPQFFVDAAGTALLAATRRGDDVANLNDAAVTRLSGLARAWLARQLELDSAEGAPRGRLRDDLERWLRDPRLRAARDPRTAATFGAGEAAAWQALFEKARAELKTALAH
jgi:tetratricopeptide (TPR) repeat protein